MRGQKPPDCSDTEVQVTLRTKLPNNEIKKRLSESYQILTIFDKEINLIYRSSRYDQMNQSTVPALTSASSRFKIRKKNQTFSLLVDMTEKQEYLI